MGRARCDVRKNKREGIVEQGETKFVCFEEVGIAPERSV